MKTVMDAVNEFKGEWPILISFNSDWCFYSPKNITFKNEKMYFSEPEFNDLVSQLETNFGESDITNWYIWQEGIKREGEACCVDCNHEWRCKLTEVETMACPNCGDKPQLRVNKPSQPVYTQAMADNGELPAVGMEFIFCDSTNTKNNSIVTYVSEWNIVFKCLDDGFSKDVELAKEISGINIARQILPLDTRTDREKAIDEIIDEESHSIGDALSIAYDKWVGEE